MKRKLFAMTASLSLLASLVVPAHSLAESQVELEDGVYQGAGQGFEDEIQLEVHIEGGEITAIEVVEHNETPEVFERALPVFVDRVLETQDGDVELVSAATYTSRGLKNALVEALEEAGAEFGELNYEIIDHDDKEEAEALSSQVVVVGGGPAGLAAAISAAQSGVEDVILVEKLDILSGNGKFDLNFFDIYNTVAMEENDNEITKEEFIERKEDSVDSPERVEAWAEKAGQMDEWLRDLGIELNYNTAVGSMGHLREKGEHAGDYIQTTMEEAVEDLGVQVITGTKAVDLLFEDGHASGIVVEDKDSTYEIHAPEVIVATGGFSANPEKLEEYIPEVAEFYTSNQLGATGDMIDVFEEHDLKLGSMEEPRVFKTILLPRRNLTCGTKGGILLNKHGERFVDETAPNIELGEAMRAQDDHRSFIIFDDDEIADDWTGGGLQKQVDKGYYEIYDSLEEMAEALEMDVDTLTETIETFNQAHAGEVEDPFREEAPEMSLSLDGPFYVGEVQPAIHMTTGGVVCDDQAQVLNNDDEVVPGLYAAGEVTETSGAYAASVIWGRIAGERAADHLNE